MMLMVMFISIFLIIISTSYSVFDWSFQQKLTVSVNTTSNTYGLTPPLLIGRGFVTLISGYGKEDNDNEKVGIYVHTTDDGFIRGGHMVWSQHAKLTSPDLSLSESTSFGKWMVSWNQTLVVSAPDASSKKGFVFIFNGTHRHWSQVQRLAAPDQAENDLFGGKMALHNNRLIVTAMGATFKSGKKNFNSAGTAYVYERPEGTIFWSRTAKLYPRDSGENYNFGQDVAIYNNLVAISAKNDGDFMGEKNNNTGSVYLYTGSAGIWSQQQKLVAFDFQVYARSLDSNYQDDNDQAASFKLIDATLGERKLGPSVAVDSYGVAVGITNKNPFDVRNPHPRNRESVYLYNTVTGADGTTLWSNQQKLFSAQDSTQQAYKSAGVYMNYDNSLITTVKGPYTTSSYFFKTFGNGWSLQQLLTPFDETKIIDGSEVSIVSNTLTNPAIYGGYLLSRNNKNPTEIEVRTRYRNDSCLQIWMSDHFLDGWDTAVLTVRAPDLTNDTFHPHCDQVDPFLVRYCPYQPEDQGVYIIKVFAALKARFFWEISWRVQVESTGIWYKGDFATKMEFKFSANTMTFTLVGIQNEVDLEAPCYSCTRISTKSWKELQVTGNSAFWPLVVTGAPYYISEYQGRLVYSSGKVCEGARSFECYQTLTNGVYTLRLGGGLFGRLTGFPYSGATWSGCGSSGDYLDQLVFLIANGECKTLQISRYTDRCNLPAPIDYNFYQNGGKSQPSATGTMAPTQNVFGERGSNSGANSYRRKHEADVNADGGSTIITKEIEVDGVRHAEDDGSTETDGFALLNNLLKQRSPA